MEWQGSNMLVFEAAEQGHEHCEGGGEDREPGEPVEDPPRLAGRRV
jgi:hypothetical protein